MRDQIARDARPGFEDPASLRPEGEPVGIDRLWLGKSAVNRIGNRRDRGQIGRAHRPPLAAHGWPRNGATTAAVTRSGRPLCLSSSAHRSEEHTSELQSLMRISYAVFFLKKTN